MPPTLTSPNVHNYFVGKGMVMFKPDGAADYHHLGNVPEFEFEPSLETLEHFSSMAGVRVKDLTVVLQKGGTVRIVMEEMTARNLALFLLGDVDMTDPDSPSIEIFGRNLVSGALRFIGTNEVGPRWTFDFNRVDFVPTGSFSPISDEWGNIEVTGELASVGGSFGVARMTNLAGDGPPISITPPTVTGSTTENATLTASPGTWSGSPAFTYQWLRDGVNIAGATASTYLLASADVGAMISVSVTATNDDGSETATSDEVGPVIAA